MLCRIVKLRPMRTTILLMVTVLYACTHAPSTTPPTQIDPVAAHAARATQFSEAVVRASASGWSAAEVAALSDFYTEEAILFPPRGEPIRGRDAVHRYWSRSPDRKILEHTIETERVDIDGDLAADHGTFAVTFQSGEEAPQKSTMRFVSIWRRGSDGAWRKQLDTWW